MLSIRNTCAFPGDTQAIRSIIITTCMYQSILFAYAGAIGIVPWPQGLGLCPYLSSPSCLHLVCARLSTYLALVVRMQFIGLTKLSTNHVAHCVGRPKENFAIQSSGSTYQSFLCVFITFQQVCYNFQTVLQLPIGIILNLHPQCIATVK